MARAGVTGAGYADWRGVCPEIVIVWRRRPRPTIIAGHAHGVKYSGTRAILRYAYAQGGREKR